MSEPTWIVNDHDKTLARTSLQNQIKFHGLEEHFSCVEFEDFLDNLEEVMASYISQVRFLQNVIHKSMEEKIND